MSHTKALVSIAMTTYNGEKYLREQLDSIYRQTHKNIEVIVCDDRSTDNTANILEEYSRKFALKYYINENNLGFVKNFEKVISLCNGDYIALADQDDVWLKNKIEVLLNEIGENLLIHTDCTLIDEQSNIISRYWKGNIESHTSFEDFLFSNMVTGCTVLMSQELQKKSLPFPEGLAYHDWWLGIVSVNETRLKYITTPLTLYRQHSSQDTGAYTNKIFMLNIFKHLKFFYQRVIINDETERTIINKTQLQNLHAIYNVNYFEDKTKDISDSIEYFTNLIENSLHFQTFLIGLRYSKHIYPKNFLYLKNILKDIIG